MWDHISKKLVSKKVLHYKCAYHHIYFYAHSCSYLISSWKMEVRLVVWRSGLDKLTPCDQVVILLLHFVWNHSSFSIWFEKQQMESSEYIYIYIYISMVVSRIRHSRDIQVKFSQRWTAKDMKIVIALAIKDLRWLKINWGQVVPTFWRIIL